MKAVAATVFVRDFSQLQREVREEPIVVTSHERITGYFISPKEYEELETLRAKAGRIVRLENLSDEKVEALRATSMDKSFDHLNALMDD